MRSLRALAAKHLSRISSTGQFIPEIDGLRFFAIAAVLAVHVLNYVREKRFEATGARPGYGILGGILSNGHFGVQLFFALSGFILALPFARAWRLRQPRPRLSNYYWRRITRIEPPYLISLAVYFLMLVWFTARTAAVLFPHLLASTFYVHNLVYGRPSDINVAAWSLEIEVQFYILAPLFSRIFAVESTRLRRAILVLAMAASLTIPEDSVLTLTLLYQIRYFLAGFLLADFYLWTWREQPAQSYAWDFLTVPAAAAFLFFHKIPPALGVLVLPFCTLVFCVGAFRGTLWRRVVRIPFLTITGGMCYSIYLYHELIIYAAGRKTMSLYRPELGFGPNLVIQCALLFAIVLAASVVLFMLTERPFMKRGFKRKPASPPATVENQSVSVRAPVQPIQSAKLPL